MARFRLASALFVLAVSSPAWAEHPDATIGWNKGVEMSQVPSALSLPASAAVSVAATPEVAPPATKPKKKSKRCNPGSCGYKALLGGLVITRDLQASDHLSLRVLPTSHALGGDDAATPFLVRPEADGYYGVRLRAKF